MFKKFLCMHSWKVKEKIRTMWGTGGVKGYTFIYSCEKCGKFKKIREG